MGTYLAKDLNIVFMNYEDKVKFDKWFDEQHFENTAVDTIIDKVDDFLFEDPNDETKDTDCIFGTGNDDESSSEENYIKSVYQYRFGENWIEEYFSSKDE